MCVQILTRYTLFQSFKRHNIAIITHGNHHGKYDLKQAKWTKIVLEMHDRAKNTCVFFQHVVVCSGMVWSALHKSLQKVQTHGAILHHKYA